MAGDALHRDAERREREKGARAALHGAGRAAQHLHARRTHHTYVTNEGGGPPLIVVKGWGFTL